MRRDKARLDVRFLLDKPALVFVTVCLALVAASALGYRLALSSRINEDSHHHEHITGLREGLFVLLALLLGFTVAMVLPRYDQRNQLVIDEANAIGTTMLRAEVLPEPQRGKTLQLLHEYVDLRRDFAAETLIDRSSVNSEAQQTKAIQRQLWQEMIAVTQKNQSGVVATYLQSLNAMIDIAETRLAVFENRVPPTVWLIIFLVAAFQCFTTGFSLKRRFWFSLVMTPLVVAVVMALVADLDSPHTGFITIHQDSMERLVQDVDGAKP